MADYIIQQIDEIAKQKCPCGWTRRAFVRDPEGIATMHMVEIAEDSRTHYHKKLTEIYFVLEGQGHIELDGDEMVLKPNTCIMIKPGCRHRAVGKLKLLITAIPAFDPADEWFDT